MATPHHIPALPTASPVTVGLRGVELVRSSSERLLLQRVRRRIAAGERRLNLMLGPNTSRTRLALAAALDIGGDILVLTTSSARRKAWRSSFRRLGDLDLSSDSSRPVEGSALTCITFRQLDALQQAEDAELERRNPFGQLAVVIVDAPRLRRRARQTLQALLTTGTSPVVLSLPLQFDRSPGPAVDQQVFAEPGLLVKSGQMAPYQELIWLASVSEDIQSRLDLDVQCARTVIDRLAEPIPPRHAVQVRKPVPDLTQFVSRALPQPDPGASRRHAWLGAYARNPRWTTALVRAHLFFGGELPSPVRQLLEVAVDLNSEPTLGMWSQVLNEYRRRLATDGSEEGIRRRELAVEGLRRLGYDQRKYRFPATRLKPRRDTSATLRGCASIIEAERLSRPDSRVLILVDGASQRHSTRLGPEAAARRLSAQGIPTLALLPSGLWAPPAVRRRLLKAIRPHHPENDIHVDERGVVRFLGDVDWNPVAAWIHWALEQAVVQTLVCAPLCLSSLARHAGPRGAHPLAHVVIDVRESAREPLPLTVSRVLDPRETGNEVLNLWRVLPCAARHPSGTRALRGVLSGTRAVASLTDDGRLQYGRSEILRLLEEPVTESTIARFNELMWKRAGRLNLARENWRAISGRRRAIPTVEVEQVRRVQPPLMVKTGGEGAAMSEIRARHRHHKLLSGRRHLVAQCAIACIIAALVLPTVAGPILGSAVGVFAVAMISSQTRRRLRQTRLATLARPESSTAVMRDIACIVLRSLRSCEGIPQARLPTSRIRCSESPRGELAIWLDTSDKRIARLFADAVVEALGPIVAHRYIIGRPETAVPGRRAHFDTWVASYHPVPSIFGSRRQRAELYAGHWAQVFGAGKLRYTAGGKGRLLRFVHFGRNHLGLKARRATALD